MEIMDQEEIFKRLLKEIEGAVHSAKDQSKNVYIAFSGGETPKSFFKWVKGFSDEVIKRVVWTVSDERYVEESSDKSNFGNMDRLMLQRLGVKEDRKLRWSVNKKPDEAVQEMREKLKDSKYDLCILGMGEDCHVASIFPSNAWPLSFTAASFTSIEHLDLGVRLTVTPQGIRDSKKIIMLVTGAKKVRAMKEVFENPSADEKKKPVQLLGSVKSKTLWLVDAAAVESVIC